MRSIQVKEVYGFDSREYSDLKVMRSAAGWYVGTEVAEGEDQGMPGSRDSYYCGSYEEAFNLLQRFEKGNLAGYRYNP